MKNILKRSSSSAAALVSALVLFVAGILPALVITPSAFAAGEVTSRSITMGQSAPGATGVTYTVQWNEPDTTSIQYIVVQFCSDSSITTSTTCVYPTGFSLAVTSPTYGGALATCGSSFTAAAAQVGTSGTAVNNTAEFTDSSGCTQTANNTDSISLPSDVTNPTTTCSTNSACEFWARIYTYSAPVTFTTGDQTSIIDEGGVALSTASTISLSATVEEQINFCVYASGSSCGVPASITMGSGTPPVISSTAVSTGDVVFSLTTNASHGVTVSVLGSPNFTSGANTIAAQTTAGVLATGTTNGAWGLYVKPALCAGLTATSPYGTTTSTYVFTATATTATQFSSTTAPIAGCTQTVEYGIVAGTVTLPGVYTANDQMIATGTY